MAESLAASGGSISNAVVEVFPSTQGIPALGSECLNCASASTTPPYSVRIATMMQERENCSDEVEFDMASSKDHWTAVDDKEDSEDVESCALENREALLKANQETLKNLRSHSLWSPFFSHTLAHVFPYDRPLSGRVGKKIAEGGQAEIYESSHIHFVLKVFKRGFLLEELQKQWPQNVFSQPSICHLNGLIRLGFVLDDGRFAFLMSKYGGDLRRAMDWKMLENKNSGPPFSLQEIWTLVQPIVRQMVDLHRYGVCHKDLKADNILVDGFKYSHDKYLRCRVADYECSNGILGTTFWRAPEILLAEKKFVLARRNRQEPPPPPPFSKVADVYSFGMLLYEICTGYMPFEREGFFNSPSQENYDRVIDGQRPELPEYIIADLKDLITKCWHRDPKQRPTFEEIMEHYVIRFRLKWFKEGTYPPYLLRNYDKISTGHQQSQNPFMGTLRKAICVRKRQLSMGVCREAIRVRKRRLSMGIRRKAICVRKRPLSIGIRREGTRVPGSFYYPDWVSGAIRVRKRQLSIEKKLIERSR